MYFITIFLCVLSKSLFRIVVPNIILVFSSVFKVSFCAANRASSHLVHSKLIHIVLNSGVTHHPVNSTYLNRTLCLPLTQCL